MSGFFQRSSRGPTSGGTARLVLAAFGKHPGWNDHIPGIGVETEALAYVKQTLYVSGIGRQVDSGAWEKLEPGKRLEGFDHVFFWQRANHALLGELWSSSDRKGRSKYPMVLCVDGENVSADFLLEKASSELERLRGICKAASTAEQVISECQTAQNRLDGPGVPGESKGSASTVETRRRFLEHPDVGPEQIGLSRVLHELRMVAANGSGKPGQTSGGAVRSCHLRVPATGNSTADSLALWTAFFQAAVPKGTPILLLCRKTANWLDAVIGEPDSDVFFCLGASLNALPLTTQIPYDLAPELKSNLEKVKAVFLGEELAKPVGGQSVSPSPRAVEEKQPPVSVPSQKKRNWILPLVMCVAVLAGAGGFWLIKTNRSSNSVAEAKPPPTLSAAPATAGGTATADDNYNLAMKDARAALNQRDFARAIAKADQALGFKKEDTAAAQLKSEAQAQQQAGQNYQSALESAQQAFNQSNYTAAVAQTEAALKIKPNDPAAMKLKGDATAQLQVAAIMANQRQKYESAMKAAQTALDRQDFSNAMAQADAAMSIKANDPAAAKLKATAQGMAAAVEKYNAAMSGARAAFERKDYTGAIAKSGEALNLRTNDAAAALIKHNAVAALAQADQDSRFAKFMSSAQAADQAGDFSNALAQVNAALAIRPGDGTATALYQKAGQELANQIKARDTGRFEVELEVYLVRFGLLDPRKAKTPEAQHETQWLGELSIQQKDQSLKDVETIRAAFQTAGKMDVARGKQLDQLKAAINDHL